MNARAADLAGGTDTPTTHTPHDARTPRAGGTTPETGSWKSEKTDPRKTLQNLLTKASKRETPIEKKKEKKKSKRRKRKEKEDKKRGGSMAL